MERLVAATDDSGTRQAAGCLDRGQPTFPVRTDSRYSCASLHVASGRDEMRDPASLHDRSFRCSPFRRRFLARTAGILLSSQLGLATRCALAAGEAAAGGPAGEHDAGRLPDQRIALLICCGSYPDGKSIQPARKNGRDLEAALRLHGFDVQVENDADRARFAAAVERFGRRMAGLPDDGRGIGLVYFCGHGMQYEGRNYLLPSGVASDDPKAKEKSVNLQDEVLAVFPQRYPGLGVAVIDACRDGISEDERTGAFNYSTAPTGCIVAFSASAGQVSLSPSDPNQNSFYTRELVHVLTHVDQEISFTDIFEFTRLRVAQTMSNHSLAIIRKLAQRPHMTRGQTGVFRLGKARATGGPRTAEDEAFEAVVAAPTPADIKKAAESLLRVYPTGRYEPQTRVALAGAEDALRALSSRFVRLSLSAFRVSTTDERFAEDMRKALRGDKDAAARIAEGYRLGSGGVAANPARSEQWLRYSGLLGNAIACYQLYRQLAQKGDPDAEFFGPEAVRLGYQPPKGLCGSRKSDVC